jgi:hypothetical protein
VTDVLNRDQGAAVDGSRVRKIKLKFSAKTSVRFYGCGRQPRQPIPAWVGVRAARRSVIGGRRPSILKLSALPPRSNFTPTENVQRCARLRPAPGPAHENLLKVPRRHPIGGRRAASRDKVGRNKATILTFRLRARDADHIRYGRKQPAGGNETTTIATNPSTSMSARAIVAPGSGPDPVGAWNRGRRINRPPAPDRLTPGRSSAPSRSLPPRAPATSRFGHRPGRPFPPPNSGPPRLRRVVLVLV